MDHRECPYCHQQVSYRNCLFFHYSSSRYTVRCNHCKEELELRKAPWTLWVNILPAVAVIFGCMLINHFVKLSFWGTMGVGVLIGVVVMAFIFLIGLLRIEIKS